MSRQQNLGQYCFYIHVMSGFSYLIFVRDMGSESTSRWWWLRSGLSFLMMQGGGLRATAAQQYSTTCFKYNVFFFLGKQCYNSQIAAEIHSSKNCSGGAFPQSGFRPINTSVVRLTYWITLWFGIVELCQ